MKTKEYLKNIMEMEQAIYTTNKAIGYLQYKSKNLSIKKNYTEPEKPVKYDGVVTGLGAGYTAVNGKYFSINLGI